jgi:hypothetical protein
MKTRWIVICVLTALCGKAAAQSRDIGLQVGLNVPISDKSMIGSDVTLGVCYGQFHYNGLGFRAGFQYAASTASINDVFGVPVAFAYRTRSKSAQERFESGIIGAWNAGGFLAGFLVNLFSDMEFFAGMTPGYIAGASERPGRSSWGTPRSYWEDTWVEKKNAFSLTLDAGMALNYSIWRFDLKLTPAFHYNLTNNYLYHVDSGGNGPEVLKSTTTPLRWFFTLGGGLAFRF